MSTLQDRLAEVMRSKGWKHSDLMRLTGQSSSLVSQWLGAGKTPIKRIAKVETLAKIEHQSGYTAVWIATGKGPKFTQGGTAPAAVGAVHDSQQGVYNVPPLHGAVSLIRECLAELEPPKREEAVDVFALMAKHPDRTTYADLLISLLAGERAETSQQKRRAAGR